MRGQDIKIYLEADILLQGHLMNVNETTTESEHGWDFRNDQDLVASFSELLRDVSHS